MSAWRARLDNIRVQKNYLIAGVLFGLLFPLVAWTYEFVSMHLSFSGESIRFIVQSNPLILMISTAPFFLGLFSLVAGIQHARVIHERDRVRQTSGLLVQRSEDLEKAITLLRHEERERQLDQDRIRDLAYHDQLTGLPNRTLLTDRLKHEISRAKRAKKGIGIIFIDMDSFKDVNDSMGHDSGDDLLIQVASRLADCVRTQDTVSRFGGDEFLVMVTDLLRQDDVLTVAESIMNCFATPLKINGQELFVTASVGIALYPEDGEEPEILIKNADLAMYASKERGKKQYTLCSSLLKESVLTKMKLTNSLYRALERDELELFYQPQIHVVTNQIIGLEALIRWNHPTMGRISPADFIPLAETTGLINPIGEWVLRTACQQSVEMQKMGIPPVRMSVNLSLVQFQNANFVDSIREILNETGLKPQQLEFEITESIAIRESSDIAGMMAQLKALGATISIDDFGTEYSSLSRLKTLPVDRIKMDMQYVHSISRSQKDDAITKIIIQLARNLGIRIIAEGVETGEQLNFLVNQMCDEVQGFLFYQPMPAGEIKEILIQQNRRNSAGEVMTPESV